MKTLSFSELVVGQEVLIQDKIFLNHKLTEDKNSILYMTVFDKTPYFAVFERLSDIAVKKEHPEYRYRWSVSKVDMDTGAVQIFHTSK